MNAWAEAMKARAHRFAVDVLTLVKLEEADEAEEWLDVIHDANLTDQSDLTRLRAESKELRAIFAKAVLTARTRQRRSS